MDELRRLLTLRLESVPGLLALVISDHDGVPILKASVEKSNVVEQCFRYFIQACSDMGAKAPSTIFVVAAFS